LELDDFHSEGFLSQVRTVEVDRSESARVLRRGREVESLGTREVYERQPQVILS
jgi:hypothetical protein